MEILGEVSLNGKRKELLLIEEDGLFKYYSLELMGIHTPQKNDTGVMFKEEINLSNETKIEILKLLKLKISKKIINEKYAIEMLGQVKIEGEDKEILLKREDEIFKYYYLN